MKILLLLSLFIMAGCTTSSAPQLLPNGEVYEARTLLDRVEFGEDEIGCVDIRGEIDLNPAPFFTSKAQIILKKEKKGESGEDAPEC